jgi:two-component system, cell cycle sensor histidine kinase and response regulator CckA
MKASPPADELNAAERRQIQDAVSGRDGEALRMSEERFREMAESIADVFWVTHPDLSEIQYVNPAYEKIWGRSVASLYADPQQWKDAILSEDRARMAVAFDSLREGRSASDIEYRIALPDGSIRWIHDRRFQIRDALGKPIRVTGIAQDITERKNAEQELHIARTQMEQLLAKSPAMIYRMKVEGENLIPLMASGNTNSLLGFEAAETPGSEWWLERLHPESREAAVASVSQALSQGESRTEYQLRHKDGSYRWVDDNRRLLCDASGKPIELVGAWTDITERKKADGIVLRQQVELRALFDLIPAMIWFKDTKNGILRANKRAAEVTGKSVEEIEGRSCAEIFPDEAEGFYADDLELIRSGAEKVEIVETIRNREGVEMWVRTNKVPYKNCEGRVTGIVVVAEDITEQKRAEEALRLLSSAVEQSKESIVITDAQLDPPGPRILFVNPGFTQMTGYSAGEAVGKSPRLLQGPDTDRNVLRRLKESLGRGEASEGQAVNYRKDGTKFQMEWQIAPLRNGGGAITHYVAIQRDITQRKELETQLFQSQKMETVGELAGGIAHEFNNIMTSIMGQSELLLGDLPAGSPLTESATEIREAAERAANLTRQLLAYGRRQILLPEVLDLNAVLAGMGTVLRHLAGRAVELKMIPEPGLKNVNVDAGQIEQVIMNMVMNATDAMPNGGRLTLATANVTLAREDGGRFPEFDPGEYVMLAITDTGVGMSETIKARIFEPFFSTRAVGQGTGLGLATCYGILKQSGGHITVDSEPGRGATFRIYLPQVPPAAKSPARGLFGSQMPRGSETILLVEDDPALREMAAALLGRLGYTVLTAANGLEALGLAHLKDGRHMDLLVTDAGSPRMTGKELSGRIQALYPQATALFISVYLERGIARHGVVHEGVAVLRKPFTPMALALKLREVLDCEIVRAAQDVTP